MKKNFSKENLKNFVQDLAWFLVPLISVMAVVMIIDAQLEQSEPSLRTTIKIMHFFLITGIISVFYFNIFIDQRVSFLNVWLIICLVWIIAAVLLYIGLNPWMVIALTVLALPLTKLIQGKRAKQMNVLFYLFVHLVGAYLLFWAGNFICEDIVVKKWKKNRAEIAFKNNPSYFPKIIVMDVQKGWVKDLVYTSDYKILETELFVKCGFSEKDTVQLFVEEDVILSVLSQKQAVEK